MLVVSVGFKTIRVDLHRFLWIWYVFIDLGRFYMISTIWQIGVGSVRFRNIWWTWFGESEWICLIFCGFELFWWIWADFNRFGWICVDLGWLERWISRSTKMILITSTPMRGQPIPWSTDRPSEMKAELMRSTIGVGHHPSFRSWTADD